MKYRKEVDGLRAVAVVPVILFHAGFEIFSGGFVGVDVFFVISGYLITTILVEDIEQERFSLLTFYERRARRILPALFFIMFLCTVAAQFLMFPNQFEEFSRSLIAVSLFASNILFWREGEDYFAAGAEEKPLLHTWSLAVEEQYYLLFPVFLVLAWRFGKSRVFLTIVLLSIVSLALCEWGWRNKPGANFYLAITRAWELFAGSIAAFIVRERGVRPNEAASFLGLAAVLFAIFLYDGTTPFPSIYALLPVAGVVLIVLFGTSETIAGKILANPAFVGIGLISYSAYLWHQPLFAFARIIYLDEVSRGLMLGLSLASIVLAWFSWKFVERPFRKRGGATLFDRRTILSAAAAGCVAFIAFGIVGTTQSDRMLFMLSGDRSEVYSYLDYPRARHYEEGTCYLEEWQSSDEFAESCDGGRGGIVIGDSHAAALHVGLGAALDISQLSASACPPILKHDLAVRRFCHEINEYRLDRMVELRPERVILHANWALFQRNTRPPDSYFYDPALFANLGATIRYLKDNGIAGVVVIGGVPQFPPTLPERLLRANRLLSSTARLPTNLEEVRAIDARVEAVAEKEGAVFVSLLDALCEDDVCDAVIEAGGNYYPIAFDYGHLTAEGSSYVVRKILGQLNG